MNPLIDALFTHGYYVWDNFLTPDEVAELREHLPNEWNKARIGRSEEAIREASIRSDKIQWLEPSMGKPVESFLDRMEEIRLEANRHFFLGLFEFEAHFAKYEQGDFYQKHLDSFQHNRNRRLTIVFYLNDDWQESDGGELVVYDLDDNLLTKISPQAGRLAVFFSEQFPHEVLPANRKRYSIAGWFRVNGVTENYLDIAS